MCVLYDKHSMDAIRFASKEILERNHIIVGTDRKKKDRMFKGRINRILNTNIS